MKCFLAEGAMMPHDSTRDSSVGAERRRFPRYSFIASAEAIDVKTHVRIRARINDLAREGCYVDTISPFEVGAEVKIQITKDNKRFSAYGRVLYPTMGMGMGILFTRVEPAELPILQTWLAELSGESNADVAAEENETVNAPNLANPENTTREALNQLITTLLLKGILTNSEAKTILQKLTSQIYVSTRV
jgi:hypothetical protein